MATAKKAPRPAPKKSVLTKGDMVSPDVNVIGRSYYCYCLEQAATAIAQARALVVGDAVDWNHELPVIQKLINDAMEVM